MLNKTLVLSLRSNESGFEYHVKSSLYNSLIFDKSAFLFFLLILSDSSYLLKGY
jgi:hypothetical protein